ncbi:MAG: thiamine pyrophosphate-dependent dehydrogenase E1 component subunit alpha [Chloroflexota bacterium]
MTQLSQAKLKELFTTLLKVRLLEERLIELSTQGQIPGWLHSGLGEEAVGVGVVSNLNQDDYVSNTHRGRSQAIPKGVDLKGFMAETLGKATGTCKGKSGEMHFGDIKAGVLGASAIMGANIPVAAGVALSCQMRKTGQVTVCFFGDGTVDEGTFHETLNVASLWKLPIVFVCENNGWAQFEPQTDTAAQPDIYRKAAAYNMPGKMVDGNDLLAVYEAAGEAIARARKGDGPTLLECKVKRWLGHYVGDPQKYRDPADIEAVRQLDPVPRLQKKLLADKVITETQIEDIKSKIKAEIEEAVVFAQNSPPPEPSAVYEDVYCEEGV